MVETEVLNEFGAAAAAEPIDTLLPMSGLDARREDPVTIEAKAEAQPEAAPLGAARVRLSVSGQPLCGAAIKACGVPDAGNPLVKRPCGPG